VWQCRAATGGQEYQLNSRRFRSPLCVAKLINPPIIAGHSQVCAQVALNPHEQSLHLLSSPKTIMHDQDA
jgi:hypothetical protein